MIPQSTPYHSLLNMWLLWSSWIAKLMWLTFVLPLEPDPVLCTYWVSYKRSWVGMGGTLNLGSVLKYSHLSSAAHLPCKPGQAVGPPQYKMRLSGSDVSKPHTVLYLFPKAAAATNCPKLGNLKQKSILSWFQRPEVENQNVSRCGSFLEALRKNLFHASLLNAGGCQHPWVFLRL